MNAKHLPVVVMCACLCASTHAIDYKKNVISNGSNNYSSSTSLTISRDLSGGGLLSSSLFGSTFRGASLDDRIAQAERTLAKLKFIRDVCPKLENEVAISFEKLDLREVMEKVGSALEVTIPYEIPDGEYLVQESSVAGMPADEFIETVAGVAGLRVEYGERKIVFHRIAASKE